MKDTLNEFFFQTHQLFMYRGIMRVHEACKDCNPQKRTTVMQRIKAKLNEEFYACTNDIRICAISKFSPFFYDEIDQFQSRSYEEHFNNAKEEFIKYYSCRERNFWNENGLIFKWSSKRIIYELAKFKANYELSEMTIAPPSLIYDVDDEYLIDNYKLFPSNPPVINDSSLVTEFESQIAKEQSETAELEESTEKHSNIKKQDFKLLPNYNFLVRLHDKLITYQRITKIDIHDFLSILYDKPTANKINWIGNKKELAFLIIALDSRLTLTSSFKGRANSIKYEKWVQIIMHYNEDIKHDTLKQKILKVMKEMLFYKKDISAYLEVKSINEIISSAEANISVTNQD